MMTTPNVVTTLKVVLIITMHEVEQLLKLPH